MSKSVDTIRGYTTSCNPRFLLSPTREESPADLPLISSASPHPATISPARDRSPLAIVAPGGGWKLGVSVNLLCGLLTVRGGAGHPGRAALRVSCAQVGSLGSTYQFRGPKQSSGIPLSCEDPTTARVHPRSRSSSPCWRRKKIAVASTPLRTRPPVTCTCRRTRLIP
jgi:hypothetical protein